MTKIITLFLFISFSLYAKSINIAVAANVSYAIHALVNAYNKTHPNTKVQITLGSSGKLTAQIQNGAPYDIFMSANMKYPNALYAKALALTKPLIYAKGSLAIFSTRKRDFSQGINIVKDKNIKTIAIANPKTAPYGRASVEALKNAKLYKEVKNKFVYAESVSQTVAYSVTATDLGFIAKSALFSPRMQRYKKGINFTDVNPKLYKAISQGVVILKRAAKNPEAKSFYDFLFSAQAKKIFKKYGYFVE